MALSNIEEERKRKEAAAKQSTPTTDPFLASLARGDYNTPGPVVKQAKPTPGNPMSESFYGGPDNSPRTRPQIGQLQPDGSRMVIDERPLVQSNNIKPPTLKEIPNAQRDAELGKMTVSTKGNIATYDIGGNTLSIDLSQKDRPAKTNLANINKQPTNNQPTWDDYHAQQSARYNALNPRKYGSSESTPVTPKPIEDNSFGGLFLQGLQSRKNMTDANIANLKALQDIKNAEVENQANSNLIDFDRNRINEMDVQGQNKWRDIQGQVAQRPPEKENQYKPIVIEEPDPNDPTGMSKRQRIMINPDGKGYVDGMAEQTGKTTFDEPQSEIIERLSKMRESKDPRLAAAEAKYKAVFGNLPY